MSFLNKIFAGKKNRAPEKTQRPDSTLSKNSIDAASGAASRTGAGTYVTHQKHHQELLQSIIDRAGISPGFDIDINDFEKSLFKVTSDIIAGGRMDDVSWNQYIAYTETCERAKEIFISTKLPFVEKFGEEEDYDKFVVQFLKNYLLAAAICEKDKDRVEGALSAGAKPNTATSRCLYRGKTITPVVQAAVINSFEITKMLIEKGADPNFTQANGESALAVAASNGNKLIVEYLLQHDANPNIKSWAGTPLATVSDPDIVKLLLERGSDPNIPDRDGDLPIVGAISQNNTQKTKLLIDFGTNLLHKNHQGITVIDYAKRLKNRASRIVLEQIAQS